MAVQRLKRMRGKMKPEEAIETIKIAIAEVEWNYPMDYTVAFEEAIEALEKADKYRWHDLRKNPDDLPEADGNSESEIEPFKEEEECVSD